MGKANGRHRSIFIVVILLFLFLHQLDTTLINHIIPNTTDLFFQGEIGENVPLAWGRVVIFAMFLIWGILHDSHSRKNLLSLSGLLWSTTSWLMGIAPTFGTFSISLIAGELDHGSFSGIYAMTGDIFSPKTRGRIIGLFCLAEPMAILFGSMIFPTLLKMFNWRLLLIIVGGFGFVLSLVVLFFIREPKRGEKEPALAAMDLKGVYLIDFENVKTTFKESSLFLIYGSTFFGLIPSMVIISWFAPYTSTANPIVSIELFQALLPILFGLTLGYPLSGILGDLLFRKKRNGRIIVGLVWTIVAGFFLFFLCKNQNFQASHFFILMVLIGFFMSYSFPIMITSILDITLPEVRGFAVALLLLCQLFAGWVSPVLVNFLQNRFDLGWAVLWMSCGAWAVSLLCQGILFYKIPGAVERLRKRLAYRSQLEARLAQPVTNK